MSAAEKLPYPGLRPFEQDESQLFFGRDKCVDQMIARLGEQRFLAVLGSSGTGKSSLVKTGLFSGLEMGLLPGARPRWLIAQSRPGGNPLRNLVDALLKAEAAATKKPMPGDDEIDGLQKRFKQQGPGELIRWCREGHLADDENLLVLVDQFEELFGYRGDDEREDAQALVSLLLESRRPRGVADARSAEFPIYVAITMRSEYLGACTLLRGLAEAINEGTYLTPRMSRQECEQAIVGPARVCGGDVEPRLVTRLLNDLEAFAPWDAENDKDQMSRLARRADQLPLMQHALNRMWQRANAQGESGQEVTLKLTNYRGLEQELDAHAEQVYQSIASSAQPAAQQIFRAVTVGTTAANAMRRPTKYGELIKICGAKSDDAVAAVIAAFGPAGCQFLTSDVRQTGDRLPDRAMIDIAHESLIRQWQRLSKWLEQEGRASQEWQRLKERAERREFLWGRGLSDAYKFRKDSKPTPAWAERYGGGFDRVDWLIRASALVQRGVVLIVAVAVFAGLWGVYDLRQQHQKADVEKIAAIGSAQALLNYIRDAFERGDVTVTGANSALLVAKKIVLEQQQIEPTPEAIHLLVNVECTAIDIHGDLGNYTEAYNVAKDARKLVEPLREASPADPLVLQLLYDITFRLGDAIEGGGAPGLRDRESQAMNEYREGQRFARLLLEDAPQDRNRRRELMFIDQKVGDVYLLQHNPGAAIGQYQEALQLIKMNIAEDAKNPQWRRDLANTMIRIGQTLGIPPKKDFDGALKYYRDALAIRIALAKEEPADPINLSNLANNHRVIGTALRERGDSGDLDAALNEYQQAIEIQKGLITRDPNNSTFQFSLAAYHAGKAEVLKQMGKLPDALNEYRSAYEIRDTLAQKDRANQGRQVSLAMTGISIADLLRGQESNPGDAAAQNQNLDEAIKRYRDAIAILDEARPRYDNSVFNCYIKVGDIFGIRADQDGALKEYKVASGIALARAASNPDDVLWQSNLATSYGKMADALVAQGRPHDALAQYNNSLEIVTALAAKYPEEDKWRSLAETLRGKIAKLPSSP